ncbi:MAG: hypothetical protein HZA49_01490 [Planctomycetes bacterium]|nr:hypothetical protein [Planctomycetota bacterium]
MKLIKYLRNRSPYRINSVSIISGVLSVGFLLLMNALAFAVAPTEATPDEYKVTCYKTEISTNGTTWVTCFDKPAGELVDLASPTGPGSLFGQGDVPEGTYKHIRITIMNTITYTCAAASILTDTGFNPYLVAADAHVPVYFSIDGGSTWSNDGSELLRAFPLPDPIKVEYNTSTKVVINFIITNSLKNNSGWSLEPPVMNVSSVVIKTLAVTFTGGDYFFDRSNINIDIPAITSTITPTYMRFSSGWGMITFSAPLSNEGVYTITAGANNTENSQTIDSSGGISGTINTPEIYMGPTDMTGTYFIDPSGFLNMLMPESGIIRGAVSDDGRVFIAVEAEVADSYHMIYAVKKETQLARDLNGKFIFCMYGSRITAAVDDATGLPYPQGHRMRYQVELGMVDINAAGNALTPSGISNNVEILRPLSDTQYTDLPMTEAYSNTQSGTLHTDTNGTWTLNGGDSMMQGYTLPDDSVTLLCGSTITNTSIYTDTGITYTTNVMQFGVVLNPVTSTSFVEADVVGSYTFVYRGDEYGQNGGISTTMFWVMLGRINFNGTGGFTGSITMSERGSVSTEEITGQYDVVSEIIGAAGATMSVRVIRLFGSSVGAIDPRNGPHLIMTPDKKVAVVYVPATEWLPDGDASPVETDNQARGLGFAVKTR